MSVEPQGKDACISETVNRLIQLYRCRQGLEGPPAVSRVGNPFNKLASWLVNLVEHMAAASLAVIDVERRGFCPPRRSFEQSSVSSEGSLLLPLSDIVRRCGRARTTTEQQNGRTDGRRATIYGE